MFISEVEWFSAVRRDEWWIEAQAPTGPDRFGLRHSLFDRGQDQLAGRAVFPGSGRMQSAVEIAGKVDGGADGIGGLHIGTVGLRLK